MALNLNIRNRTYENTYAKNISLPIRKTRKYIDLKLDLQQTKVGNPYYFDQSIVNGRDIAIATDEEAIIEYLKNLFSCSPGDLFLNPKFGINLKRFTFEPIDDNTAEEIGRVITDNVDNLSFFGNDNLVTINKVLIYPNIEQSQFEISLLFQVQSLAKQIVLFGTISARDGVYFFSK